MSRSFPKAVWAGSLERYASRETMARMMDRLARGGFDLVIPIIKPGKGGVLYRSERIPMDPALKGVDALRLCIEEAHQRGIKVHAWSSVFREGPESPLVREHPDVVAVRFPSASPLPPGKPNTWVCTARPEVHEYEAAIFREVMDRYDVDGIHYDFIRTGYFQCSCAVCRAKCMELTGQADGVMREPADASNIMARGYEEWSAWRVSNVTRFVETVSDVAHRAGKEVSAAVFISFPLAYCENGQDWPDWARRGLVDIVMPMNYSMSRKEVRYYALTHRPLMEGAPARIWQGLYHGDVRVPADHFMDRVRIVRQCGAQGLVIFEWSGLTDELADRLAAFEQEWIAC